MNEGTVNSNMDVGNNPIKKEKNGIVGLDLVQIRWQQIRETEFHQKIQQENIDLKSEIQKLQKQLKQQITLNQELQSKPAPSSSSSVLSPKLLEEINQAIIQYQQQCSQEMQLLKELVSSTTATFSASHSLLFQCNKRYQEIFQRTENKVIQVKKEKQLLQQSLQEIQEEFGEYKLTTSNEVTSLEKKCERLLQDKVESKQRIQVLENENQELQEQILSLSREKELWNTSSESMQEMNERLSQEVKTLQESCARLLQESTETQQQLIRHYEEMIEQMGLDNQYLRNHIQELEDQIAKLSQTLIGNKSHFAKYVEVKTENIALQSKLNSLVKKPSSGTGLPALMGTQNPSTRQISTLRKSMIAEDLNELSALTRSGKQPSLNLSEAAFTADNKTVPALALPKVSANPRHSVDNGVVQSFTIDPSLGRQMVSNSARDSNTTGPVLLSARASFSNRLSPKTQNVGANSTLVSSSSAAVVSPKNENPPKESFLTSQTSNIERKKSLRLMPQVSKDPTGSNRLSI